MSFPIVVGIFLFLIASSIFLFAAWIFYTHYRARRLGLPAPTLSSYNPFHTRASAYSSQSSSGGPFGWLRSLRSNNRRSAGGAYEEPLNSVGRGGRGPTRGFGPLDPDEAWDARVGNEADAYGGGGLYEEQEQGLTAGETAYGGAVEERGRRKSKEAPPYIGGSKTGLDRRYDEEMGRGVPAVAAKNPFGDDAEPSSVSLRGVSPRPMESPPKAPKAGETSPTRRSIFREDM